MIYVPESASSRRHDEHGDRRRLGEVVEDLLPTAEGAFAVYALEGNGFFAEVSLD